MTTIIPKLKKITKMSILFLPRQKNWTLELVNNVLSFFFFQPVQGISSLAYPHLNPSSLEYTMARYLDYFVNCEDYIMLFFLENNYKNKLKLDFFIDLDLYKNVLCDYYHWHWCLRWGWFQFTSCFSLIKKVMTLS